MVEHCFDSADTKVRFLQDVPNNASLMGEVTTDPYKFRMLVRVQHDVPSSYNAAFHDVDKRVYPLDFVFSWFSRV